jgi:hypothetical protein
MFTTRAAIAPVVILAGVISLVYGGSNLIDISQFVQAVESREMTIRWGTAAIVADVSFVRSQEKFPRFIQQVLLETNSGEGIEISYSGEVARGDSFRLITEGAQLRLGEKISEMPAFEAPLEVMPHPWFTWISHHKQQLVWTASVVGFAEAVAGVLSLVVLVVGGFFALAVVDSFVEGQGGSRSDWQVLTAFLLTFCMILATVSEAFLMLHSIAILMQKADAILGDSCAGGWLVGGVVSLLACCLLVVKIRRPATS